MKNHLKTAEILANALDNSFSIGGYRFGLSAFINLIPIIGDTIDLILASYLVWIAIKLKVPFIRLVQMGWNILFNYLIGLIPIVGDAAYILRRANMKNLEIIKRHAFIQSLKA